MKHFIKLVSTLSVFCVPIAAQAQCDRYQNDTFTLNLPATITVPDSIPVGGVITRQRFSGTAPAYFADCPVAVQSWIIGRYQRQQDPSTGAYYTEVPGVGVKVTMTWAGGGPAAFALYDQPMQYVYGKVPSFTSAEATFYKIGPVTSGTVPAGYYWEKKWLGRTERVRLEQGNSVRFVRPVATCDLAAGDVNRIITLPPIQTSALKDAVSAGEHNFELTANCTDASNVTFRFSGQPAATDSWRFANTGTAGGVALWLYSRINGVNQTIRADGTDSTRTVAVSGNRSVLPLGAAYFRTGTVSQGTLLSSATVNITYN
ncbi:fimbrial protein [Pseudomonas nabeulensis]|uniref:Fimbrial protein n=1 Tax=Pseudomonas nabeulensis TaxID=2293833 RepID=A0A4Z0B5S5_9PSED|nr:fimbrial protein [Pseudomonas nabeulensis]TFY94432.1 fimbrial protein [Pseudomonas nabeulensis]